MTKKRVVTHTPAEAAAMSICYLDRTVHGEQRIGAESIDTAAARAHSGRCRFCGTSIAELIAAVYAFHNDPSNGPAVRDFEALPRTIQIARRKEAQERAWYEGLHL